METFKDVGLNHYHFDKDNGTPKQLVLPLESEILIEKDDPVRTFHKVIEGVNLEKYLKRSSNVGRIGYDRSMLLKIILFGFMENIRSLRGLEKACKTDIRFMWLSNNERPTAMTICNFINQYLIGKIENIFVDINKFFIKEE